MPPTNFQPFEEPADSAGSLDFKKILSTLLERLWLIVLCLALGAVATVGYLARASRVYEATLVLKVDPNQLKMLDLPGFIQEDYRGPMLETKLKEIKQTVLSQSLLLRMVQTNKLASDSRFSSPLPDAPPNENRLASQLSQMIEVNIPKDNNLVVVTVGNRNPELAAQLANSLGSELILENSKSKEDLIRMVEVKLEELAQSLRKQSKAHEQEVQPYREQSASLVSQQADMAQGLRDIRQRLMEASLQRIRLEAEYTEVQKLGTNVDALLRLRFIDADPAVIAARTSLSQKQVMFDNLKQRYKEKHPKFIDAENELLGLKRMLSNDVLTAAQSVKVAIENSETTEQALQRQFDELKNNAQNLNQRLNESTNSVLVREIELQRTIYDKVMQRLKEASVTGDLFYNPITVFEMAEVPLSPAKPDQIKTAVIGLLGSLVLGITLALALGLVDTSLKSLEDTERSLNLPVLSTIPRIRELTSAQSQIVMDAAGAASAAESFRSLRTSISVLGRDKELRSVLFTSALPEEGKTVCALNYAVSLAQQGLKTVLIDCDLRRPTIAESVPCQKKDGPGLSEYLRFQIGNGDSKRSRKIHGAEADLSFTELRSKRRGDTSEPPGVKLASGQHDAPGNADPLSINNIVKTTEIENLFLVPAGNAISNPSELLAQQGLSHLLGDLLRRYDRVVVDSAPIFRVSDTMLIANRVHGLCLVIRANRTPRKAVTRAVEMLQRIEARVLGVVLNGHVASRLDGYGDPYYDYSKESRKVTERT